MSQSAIEILLSSASPIGATVVLFPACLAVFGGALSPDEDVLAGKPPKSQRDAFVQWLRKNRTAISDRLILPESYEDWNNFNTYSNLLLFEADLGYVTAAVVIFLEAPGAIAELGAFSQIESLRDQLVVVVLDSRHPTKSFISLGPLLQLDASETSSVCVVPDRAPADIHHDIAVIMESVDELLNSARPTRHFDSKDSLHQIILSLDIITLQGQATFTDLKKAHAHFKVGINETRLRQIIFTLEKTKLIKSNRYGGITYYYPLDRAKVWISHTGVNPKQPFNRMRVRAKVDHFRGEDSQEAKALQLASRTEDQK